MKNSTTTTIVTDLEIVTIESTEQLAALFAAAEATAEGGE